MWVEHASLVLYFRVAGVDLTIDTPANLSKYEAAFCVVLQPRFTFRVQRWCRPVDPHPWSRMSVILVTPLFPTAESVVD